MESYVAVQDFRHQGIESATACGNRVQDFRAVRLPLNRMLNGFDLTAQAADAIEHLFLVSKYVRQKTASPSSFDSIPRHGILSRDGFATR